MNRCWFRSPWAPIRSLGLPKSGGEFGRGEAEAHDEAVIVSRARGSRCASDASESPWVGREMEMQMGWGWDGMG